MESFFITLPSSASGHLYNNTQSHFRVQLPQPIELKGNWEVGLAEIHVPCTWNNIDDKTDTFVIHPKGAVAGEMTHRLHLEANKWAQFKSSEEETEFFLEWFSTVLVQLPSHLKPLINIQVSANDKAVLVTIHNQSKFDMKFSSFSDVECKVVSPNEKFYRILFRRDSTNTYTVWGTSTIDLYHSKMVGEQELKIPHGFYPTSKDVLEAMEEAIPEEYKHLYHIRHNRNGTVSILCKEKANLIFPKSNPGLGEMLGFEKRSMTRNPHGKYMVDIKGGVYGLYVYSDIVSPHIVGDVCTNLLRVIPVDNEGNAHSNYVKIYNNPDFYKLTQNRFESIEIDIRTDFGTRIQFRHGKTLVKLLFRKV